MKNFWIYVLESERDGVHYIGSAQNVGERLRRHNRGDYRFTKGHRPWRLVYQETVRSRSAAVKSERFFKSGVGRNELRRLIGNQLIDCPVV